MDNGSSLQWIRQPCPLYVRPGPFNSRTAIYEGLDGALGEEEEDSRLFLEVCWLPSYLERHGLRVLKVLEDLPTTPKPIGLCKIPLEAADAGLRTETAVPHDKLRLCVLAYREEIGTDVPEDALLGLHAQLIRPLRTYADLEVHAEPPTHHIHHGSTNNISGMADPSTRVTQERFDARDAPLAGVGMYRDLNIGNVLYRKVNASYVPVLADHGNARLGMVPRGDTQVKGVAGVVERGKDYARSANLFFSPLSAGQAEWIHKELRVSVSQLVEQVKKEVEDRTFSIQTSGCFGLVSHGPILPSILSGQQRSSHCCRYEAS